jgi:hypothetical protein
LAKSRTEYRELIMKIEIGVMGPWVLLLLGVVVCSSTLRNPKENIKALFIGFLLCGTSVYGLAFFDSVSKISKLTDMIATQPGAETTKKVLSAVGNGEIKPGYEKMLLTSVVNQPVPEMNELLKLSISEAKDPQGKEQLQAALARVESQQAVATQLVAGVKSGQVSLHTVTNLSWATRAQVAKLASHLNTNQIQALRLDAATTRALHNPQLFLQR